MDQSDEDDKHLNRLTEGDMTDQESAVLRVSRLPLVRSAFQSVTSAYSEVKGRYPLLGLMGGAAEVMGHLKDAVLLTLDDVQVWVVDGLDGALDQLERLSDVARSAVHLLTDTQVGRAAASGLDDVLSRLEDATAYYLPLPPILRREWETRVQDYEDEDEDDEPGLWTRVRGLLLNLTLQLHHRMTKVRGQLQSAAATLTDAADSVGLGQVLELVGQLLQYLQRLLVALLFQTESLRELSLNRVKGQAVMLAELRPVRQIRELPVQIQQLLQDLQELSKIVLQLVINATPLYNMLQQPSHQEVEDFLNQEDFVSDASSRRSSANSLFLKAMDGRPRRRRSLYSRAARGSGGPQQNLDSTSTPNGRRSSLKDPAGPEADAPPLPPAAAARRQSATELLLAPLKQLVSQSQRAFEYLSPNTADTGEDDTATSDC
ncbi:Perilipin-5 Lipid storage droplet protein 5 [Collichthys lucidus]|uniref:Perilipin-5 Lipid storage droplet protein 5 n=1 Tax=Collichthys lucidus TaxID=240159 RepID=A0A4V6ASD3_COLLU|nr:Perilipin-5 Lipid storage droplet protein 5 [Collichthys lucidus]